MAITTRPITADEITEFREKLIRGFGEDLSEEDRDPERFNALMPLDRTVAAFDGDEMVGTLAAYPFEVTVPGGASLAMPGTTVVTVQSTHRRQGVARAMMQDHLDDAAARGEPLVGLWASETTIYGRFGFGQATWRHVVEASRGVASIAGAEEGGVRSVASDQVAETFSPIYDEVRSRTPGMLSRNQPWWEHDVVHDPPYRRRGSSARRFVVYEADDRAEGYAIYAQKSDWDDFVANGQVRVIEALATTDRAHTGLWSFLSSIDLYPRIRYWNMPLDDPLWWKVADPRRLDWKRSDALWLRIMDVPAALEGRTYEEDGSVRLGLDDPFRPETSGVYELAVSDGIGKCVKVEDEADVSMGIDILGALYLGGGNAMSLAAAGLIEGEPAVVASLHRLLRTDVQPWCEEVF